MRFGYLFLAAVLVLSGCGSKETPAGDKQQGVASSSAASSSGILGDDRINAFKQKYTAPDGKNYEFTSSFIVDEEISQAQKDSLKKAGKVPYGFICELDEVKVVDGETLKNMCQGRIKFYILDSEGKVAQPLKTQSLAQMCAH
jgi:hypothetical protein